MRILLRGEVLADTANAVCALETSHPPTYYLPPSDIEMEYLHEVSGGSFCEWKGMASYYDIVSNGKTYARVAWTYHQPRDPYSDLTDHVAFYAAAMDACYVGDEKVTPQPGIFYGGWITADIVGPFKGEPGTSGW